MLALGEMCFEGMGQRGCELALRFEGMGAVEMSLRAWGQLKRGFEVLALCEMCFEGMGAVEKGV